MARFLLLRFFLQAIFFNELQSINNSIIAIIFNRSRDILMEYFIYLHDILCSALGLCFSCQQQDRQKYKIATLVHGWAQSKLAWVLNLLTMRIIKSTQCKTLQAKCFFLAFPFSFALKIIYTINFKAQGIDIGLHLTRAHTHVQLIRYRE